jgi:hypothetical protein
MRPLACILFVAACGSATVHQTATVHVSDSHLVTVNPDVQTFLDADKPVFFVAGSYWLFDDGKWWTTPAGGGLTRWKLVKKPPVPVRQIDNPFQFVHYYTTQPGKEIETVSQAPPTPPELKPIEPDRRDRPPTASDPTLQTH